MSRISSRRRCIRAPTTGPTPDPDPAGTKRKRRPGGAPLPHRRDQSRHRRGPSLLREDGKAWLILLDASALRTATQRPQQKAYDMTPPQEREAALNRQLQTSNEALLA